MNPLFLRKNPTGSAKASPLTGFYTSFWKLADVNDFIGTNNLTNSANPVTFGAGKIGDAGSFVAASSMTLIRANNATLQTGGAGFCVSVWANATSLPGVTNTIVSKDSIVGSREWALTVANTGVVTFGVKPSASGMVTVTVPGFTTGAWHLLIGWVDSSDMKIRLSMDNGAASVSAALVDTTQGTAAFQIGSRHTTPQDFWNGQIDAVGFAKGKTPTAAQIAAIWNGGNGIEPPF